MFEVNTTSNYINDKYLFDFAQRDEYLIAVVKGDSVHLYDEKGNLFQILGNHTRLVNAVDISPDDRFIATASSDKNVNIWYYNQGIDQFSIYDTITGHNDVVRSCVFSNSSDYILTSSDDSITALWKLNDTGHNLLNMIGITNRPHLPLIFENEYNRYTMGKECNAIFSTDQQSITITVYHENDNGPPEYRYYIVHAQTSKFSNSGESEYLWDYMWSSDFNPVMEYQYLVPSDNDSYVATVIKGAETTNLVAPDMLLVMKLDGIQPDFSPDGKYLLCIEGNRIHKYVIDVEEIRRLVYQEKIFGELEINYQDWITY